MADAKIIQITENDNSSIKLYPKTLSRAVQYYNSGVDTDNMSVKDALDRIFEKLANIGNNTDKFAWQPDGNKEQELKNQLSNENVKWEHKISDLKLNGDKSIDMPTIEMVSLGSSYTNVKYTYGDSGNWQLVTGNKIVINDNDFVFGGNKITLDFNKSFNVTIKYTKNDIEYTNVVSVSYKLIGTHTYVGNVIPLTNTLTFRGDNGIIPANDIQFDASTIKTKHTADFKIENFKGNVPIQYLKVNGIEQTITGDGIIKVNINDILFTNDNRSNRSESEKTLAKSKGYNILQKYSVTINYEYKLKTSSEYTILKTNPMTGNNTITLYVEAALYDIYYKLSDYDFDWSNNYYKPKNFTIPTELKQIASNDNYELNGWVRTPIHSWETDYIEIPISTAKIVNIVFPKQNTTQPEGKTRYDGFFEYSETSKLPVIYYESIMGWVLCDDISKESPIKLFADKYLYGFIGDLWTNSSKLKMDLDDTLKNYSKDN